MKGLKQCLRPNPNPPGRSRLVIVGVGQSLRGDDGMGTAVAERLLLAGRQDERTSVVVAGPAPENCLGQIIRFRPEVVVFVDAAALDRPPGDIQLLAADQAAETPGTHTPSLGVAARFLTAESNCTVYLLALCPYQTTFDSGLSPVGEQAVSEAVAALMGV